MKTPKDWMRPWRTGWVVVAVPAALGTVPRPASLENRPRRTPLRTAATIPPATPYRAWSAPKAPQTMERRTPGISVMFIARTTTVMTT